MNNLANVHGPNYAQERRQIQLIQCTLIEARNPT